MSAALPPELADDERIPVTVMLTPAQAVRLEALITAFRQADPSIDDNDVADAVFDTGLVVYETTMEQAA